MPLLYGAFSIGDRPRVLRAQRRPASGPEPRERRGELREMEPVVRHPGGEQVEPGQRAEPRVRDGVAKVVRRHAPEEGEIGGPTLAERRERRAWIGVSIRTLLYPALRVDGGEARAAVHDDAQACAEVLRLLVAQVTDDLQRRPLRRRRALAPRRGLEIAEEHVEDAWQPPEIRAAAREHAP